MSDQPKIKPPRRVSSRQIAANRESAKSSTGPKTAAGKARAALNALHHGFLAQSICVEPDNQARFQAVSADYFKEFLPATEFEATCVDQLIASDWLIHRAYSIERTLFNDIATSQENGAPFDRITAAFCELHKSGQLELIGRYRTRIERTQSRALSTLKNLRARKNEPNL